MQEYLCVAVQPAKADVIHLLPRPAAPPGGKIAVALGQIDRETTGFFFLMHVS
jgi:hypothetical protein